MVWRYRRWKNILKNIKYVPEEFQKHALALLNKVRCFAKFNSKKNYYDISVGCSEESQRVTITFERRPQIEEIRLFLNMAKYLDAMLLYRGKKKIDEKIIEELEYNSKMCKKKIKPWIRPYYNYFVECCHLSTISLHYCLICNNG